LKLASWPARAAIAGLLAGCVGSLQTNLAAGPGGAAPGVAPPAENASPPQAAMPTGRIAIAVVWPVRGPDYRAQVIPESANSIRIRVMDKTDTLLPGGEALLRRPTGGSLVSTASLDVAAGKDLKVEAKAFKLQSPSDSTVPIALGVKTGVTVTTSSLTSVTVRLDPANPPAISDFSPPNAGPGAIVRILGANFLLGSVSVRFTSEATATISVAGDTALSVEVPTGSVTGFVSLTTDGISLTSTAAFVVLKTLTLSPAATSGVATGSAVTFTLAGKDTSDATVTGASAAITLEPAPLAGEDGTEFNASVVGLRVTPTSTGSWIVKAKSGSVESTASLSAR